MHNIPFLWFIPAFLVYALFQLLLIWIFPTWIAPLFNRFTPLENQELTKGIEALVKQAGFNSQGVFVMDASKRSGHGNAYFTGIFKNKRIVFFDTLLEKLSSTQVLAVLAHEIGHLHFGHIRKGLALSLIFTFIGFFLLAYFGLRTDWFLELGLAPTHGSLLIVGTWVLSLITLPLAPVMNWWSRRHEFQADQYAVERTSSRDLGQALLELYRSNAGSVVVDKLYALWYYSHPPLSERLKAIGFEALAQE
jgi:STE24 endopeptidase